MIPAFSPPAGRRKTRTRAMRTDLFDFELPASAIALRLASLRDAARMLVVGPGRALR
ncbi:MAG: hypothetical protein MZV49_07510 [Rhodopseudomonas palustris]|nr:hypothetical protein [Rhodopseudomonas palustris]